MIDRLGSMDALRSTMRKWTPQQLQQFAMQNQDNIIAMSLISQEQRDRDEARQAQAGQQPQQPKVVEQVISELNQQAQQMPEDVGIGQLPARNLEGMADGGIVGYAAGDLIRDPETGEYYAEPLSAAETPSTSSSWDRFVKWAGRNVERDPLTGEVVRKTRADATPEPAPSPRYIPTTPSVSEPEPEKKVRQPGAAPSLVAEHRTQQPPAQSGMAGLMEQYKKAQEMVGGDGKDPYAAQREEIMQSRQEQARREEAGIEEREKGLGSLMKSREDRIAAREGKIGEQEESDQNMAIIRAGLALASSTKKGFLSAVAEGAGVGIESLAKSQSLTKAERQKIEDARDAMDELRFNQGELTRKEKIAAQNKIDEVKNIAAEQSIQALMAQKNISRQEAKELFTQTVNAQEKEKDRASARQNAAIAAGAAPADLKIANALVAESKKLGKPITLDEALKTTRTIGGSAANERADIAGIKEQINLNQAKLGPLSGYSPEEQKSAKQAIQLLEQRLQKLSEVGAASAAGYTATVNGKTYSFPTQKQADDFKKAAGV